MTEFFLYDTTLRDGTPNVSSRRAIFSLSLSDSEIEVGTGTSGSVGESSPPQAATPTKAATIRPRRTRVDNATALNRMADMLNSLGQGGLWRRPG